MALDRDTARRVRRARMPPAGRAPRWASRQCGKPSGRPLGAYSIVMEQAVLRGTARHPCSVGEHVLIGPHSHLAGCTVERDVFVATGAAVFNGATLEAGSEIRIHAVVHLKTRVAAGATVPIGWIAVGDPAEILPPDQHERIWQIQRPLDFPGTVFGLERLPPERFMPEMTRRYGNSLGRHADDHALDDEG